MRIQHNLNAMNSLRQLGSNNAATGKNLEKLSSGYRINRAGDDAAGLAISEKMRAQIRGLEQASSNAQDGISMIQTAEGALNETHSILQRMRELSVQASTDTNNTDDREAIGEELLALKEEVNRISDTTEFMVRTIKWRFICSQDTTNATNTLVVGDTLTTSLAVISKIKCFWCKGWWYIYNNNWHYNWWW